MAATKRKRVYTVRIERDEDGWWFATVLEVPGCHTQGKTIATVRERIREAMAACGAPEVADLREEIHTAADLDAELEALKTTREEADRLAKESAEKTRRVAARLAKAGLSRRDVGELLGVSFQRVQQLLG